jgi:Ser/Thr protein kinase RdoA (MazF antagonist)
VTAVGGSASTTFSRESTRAVLDEACERADLPAAAAELLRLGENAIFRLHAVPVVVRIARNAEHWDDAVKEVAVSRWLERSGVPAARLHPVQQPHDVRGHPVTFWRYIDGRRGGPDDVRELAQLLRRIHRLPPPQDFALPAEQVLGRVRARIERAPVPADDQRFLLALLDELTAAVADLPFVLPACVTHGDAHVQNLMVTSDDVQLIDFERVAWGQPEWDLAMTATEFLTAQFWTDAQYAAFVDAYGYDVTSWSGFPVLRRVHEIKMTTWLMQNVDESPTIRSEYELRMRTIRTGRPGRSWRAF